MIPTEYLREKDRRLLDLLYKFKIATIDDIQALSYDGIGKNNVYSRLKELTKLGLVQKVPFKRNGRYLSAYSLTKKSFLDIICEGSEPTIRKEFQSGKPEHDLSILRAYRRLILSEKIVDIIPENVLTSGSSFIRTLGVEELLRHNPDALIVERSDHGNVYLSLECELSIKNGFRYETKLAKYYDTDEVPAVIYICGNKDVLNFVSRVEDKYCQAYRPKVFYACIEQLENRPGLMTFTNRAGGKLVF